MAKVAVFFVGMMIASGCGSGGATMAPAIDAGIDAGSGGTSDGGPNQSLYAPEDAPEAVSSSTPDGADATAQQCTVMAGGLMGMGPLPCVGVTRTVQDRPYCVHAPAT